MTPEFQRFVGQLGLRKEVAQKLWDADIHSPQELGALEIKELRGITDNKLLLNKFHPILQKYVFNISMANDPYKAAMKVIKKQAQAMEEDDEPMDTTCETADSTTRSDALGFVDPPAPGPAKKITSQVNESPQSVNNARNYSSNVTRMDGVNYSNSRSEINSRGNSHVQSNIGFVGNGKGKNPEFGHQITITGGNFVQANVLGSGPVTYNNTNTVINATAERGMEIDVKKRRAQRLHSTLFLNGQKIPTSELVWNDDINFWVDRVCPPAADYDYYAQHLASDDIYPIRNQGRALILNNIEFTGNGLTRRTGADVDCQRMEELLRGLGFNVRRENNKTADEMKQLLHEFATSRENGKADMSLVYIGSHGERDERGNDTFVGTDGRRVKFTEVQAMFSPKNSPLLHNRPKIFLLQFCRQEGPSMRIHAPAPIQTARVRSDAGSFLDEDMKSNVEEEAAKETRVMDMLCVYATLAGTKAYRDTADGSWFVTALIRVFEKHANKDDVLSMITKVNNSVSVNKGKEGRETAVQVSEVVHSLRKKLFFYPGQV